MQSRHFDTWSLQPIFIAAALITFIVLLDLVWQLYTGLMSMQTIVALGFLIVIQYLIRKEV